MPTYRIETNQGVFRIESNRAPTPEEIQELVTSGQLQATPSEPQPTPATVPPDARPAMQPTMTGGGMGAFGQALAESIPSMEQFPSAEAMREALQEPVPSAVLGIGPEMGAEMGGQQLGAATGAALGSRFGPLGARVGAGAGRVIGGGASALATTLLRRRATGEQGPSDMAIDVMMNFAPEILESSVRGSARLLGRLSKGGQELRMDRAGRNLLAATDSVFNSPGKREASALFDRVRDLGVQIDTRGLADAIDDLPSGRVEDVLRLDIRPIDAKARSGGAMGDIFERIRSGAATDMADLQDLRSAIFKRAQATKDPQAQNVLEVLGNYIDRAIDTAPAAARPGLGPQTVQEARDTLQTARRMWTRVRAAEDMANLMNATPITRATRKERLLHFNIDILANAIRDARAGKGSPLARKFVASLERVPGALENWDTLMKQLKRQTPSNLTLSDTQSGNRLFVVGALNNMLANIMTSPVGIPMFQRAMTEGRGRMSVNALAALLNSVQRREADALALAMGATPFPETASQPIQ